MTVSDGQTIVLDAGVVTDYKEIDYKENRRGIPKRLFIFITPTIIDPAGNRVHPE